MKIHHLGEENSLLNHFIREIRSVEIQGDPLRFRRNLERIGEIMAYEISKTLDYTTVDVRTPLGVAQTGVATDGIVVASILRAGLPLHNGVLSYFDHAENCFVSAYRKYTDETHFDVHVEYIASPCLDGKTVILCDTMLATGSSMELASNLRAEANVNAGRLFIQLKKFDDAASALNRAVNPDRQSAAAWCSMAHSLLVALENGDFGPYKPAAKL